MKILKKILLVDNIHRVALALTFGVYMAIFLVLLRGVIYIERHLEGLN